MSLNAWGKHAIFNLYRCNPYHIRCPVRIKEFSKQIVKGIDMVAYGEPQIVNFGTGNKAGYTLVQLIETSNICAHFVNEEKAIYLDVFSCKEFDPEIVKDLVVEYFYAANIRPTWMVRQA
jgi:S-adenosylmethionine/arginine decarboxylase-like enzyme